MILMIWNPFGDFPREMGYPHRRGIVYSMKELINNVNLYNHKTDVFSSLYSFNKLNERGNRGLYNTSILNKIYLDLDNPENLDSITSLHNFCLENDYLHSMFWSGGGFHFYIGSNEGTLKYKKDALINAQVHICKENDLSIGTGNGFDVDSHVIGNLAQMVRIPATYNPKRKRYCISIREKDLTSLEYIQTKAENPVYGIKIYGSKFMDLAKFDEESPSRSYDSIDLSLPMSNVGLDSIDINKFPECIKYSLTKSFLNHRERYILILYLKELGLPIEDTLIILHKYLDSKVFSHCVKEEKQPYWIYKRSNLCFPSCESLRLEGFCVNKDCSGAELY